MHKTKKILAVIAVAAVMLLPVRGYAQLDRVNEMTGLILTTTANTMEEGKVSLEAYSYVNSLLTFDFSAIGSEFLSYMGLSAMYGVSKTMEVGVNINDFITGGGGIVLPEVHLNGKVNLLPGYRGEMKGIAVMGQVSYNANTTNLGYQICGICSTVIEDAVGFTVHAGIIPSNYLNIGLVTSPSGFTNFMIELGYEGTLMIMPGIRFGSTSGLEIKLGATVFEGSAFGLLNLVGTVGLKF